MTGNVYDDPTFFDAYARMQRSLHGLDGAPEWLSLRAMLPPMADLRVLDLGCGYGWFCRWARQEGARQVTGIDLSEKMLERARGFGTDAGITYVKADLDLYEPPGAAFDVVYSSLALHYLVDLDRCFAAVRRALDDQGHFVFSMEHPIFTAPARQEWVSDASGRRSWPLNSYQDQGPRRTHWLGANVTKQHRTVGRTLTALSDAGFRIVRVEEWCPSTDQVAAHPEWAAERDRPTFLLVSAHSP